MSEKQFLAAQHDELEKLREENYKLKSNIARYKRLIDEFQNPQMGDATDDLFREFKQ